MNWKVIEKVAKKKFPKNFTQFQFYGFYNFIAVWNSFRWSQFGHIRSCLRMCSEEIWARIWIWQWEMTCRFSELVFTALPCATPHQSQWSGANPIKVQQVSYFLHWCISPIKILVVSYDINWRKEQLWIMLFWSFYDLHLFYRIGSRSVIWRNARPLMRSALLLTF